MNLLKRYKVEYEVSCDEDINGEYCLNEDVIKLERQNKIMKEALEYYANAKTIYNICGVNQLAKSALKEVGE